MFAINIVGIEENELQEPGSREFVQEGITFIKQYFKNKELVNFPPNIGAITVDKPVLFRGEEGEVGLMVRINAFGSGEYSENMQLPINPLVEEQMLWKVTNFAFFNRNELYNWQYGGLVFRQ